MNQCPQCQRFGLSDKLFAGTGLCIECYLAAAQKQVDAATLIDNCMEKAETPGYIVQRIADPFYPDCVIAEANGQENLFPDLYAGTEQKKP